MAGTDRGGRVRRIGARFLHPAGARRSGEGGRDLQRRRLRAGGSRRRTRDAMRASLGVPPTAPRGRHHRPAHRAEGASRTCSRRWRRTPALADAALLVVGDGELRDELERAAPNARACRRACTFSARAAISAICWRRCESSCMPSLWEGLPLSMVLAMGAGVPVVATRVAGIPEVVAGRPDRTARAACATPRRSARRWRACSAIRRSRRRIGADARASVLPRFGVERYVASVRRPVRSAARGEGLA